MKISGFTIARNIEKYRYPAVESIHSILPICDEFIINIGKSEDNTRKILGGIDNPKIRLMDTQWDFSMGKEVLSFQTNLALQECRGDWAFYLQLDEVIHEHDLARLVKCMRTYLNQDVDALRFKWLHFYGSYYRYRIDKGWYQKQDRIIRNNGQVESIGDAFGFGRKDGGPLKRKETHCLLYHYGWVQPEDVMLQRRLNACDIGFVELDEATANGQFRYGDLKRFPAYFGSHPMVMQGHIREHSVSQADKKMIDRTYWWHPLKCLRIRYKTGQRVKQNIQ